MSALLIGLDVSTSAAPGAHPVAAAQAAEEAGFDFISCSDHPAGAGPSFETWTLLAWMAAATARIRIATRVLGVPYRSPAMVAKMAETLNRLSDGRLILGLGAGASEDEFRAYGLPASSPRQRVEGLAEAVTIIRGMWSGASFSFEGQVHRTHEARVEPRPDQPIPIWLGTFGPRGLVLTGQLADGWIPSLGYGREPLATMRARVLDAAAAAGRDPGQITCALNLDIRIGAGDADAPDVVCGTPQQVTDRLLSFVDLGFTAFNFKTPHADDVAGLATEVLPLLRQGPRHD